MVVEPEDTVSPADIYAGPCQLCMGGAEKAQYLLIDGHWQPWPLVASKPDDVPCVRLRCYICDVDGYREDAAAMNKRIAETNQNV